MIPINIDDYIPTELKRDIKKYESALKKQTSNDRDRASFSAKLHRVHLESSYHKRDLGLGIDPRKIRDWRKLEARFAQLEAQMRESNSELWRYFKDVSDRLVPTSRKERREGGWDHYDIWFSIGDDTLLMYSSESSGYTMSRASTEAQDRISNPSKYKKAVFVSEEEGGREVRRMHMRSNRLIRAAALYREAFEKAVTLRLRAFVDKQTRSSDGPDIPYNIILTNESRYYLAQVDYNGAVKVNSQSVVFISH